jgi:hypothetical protein
MKRLSKGSDGSQNFSEGFGQTITCHRFAGKCFLPRVDQGNCRENEPNRATGSEQLLQSEICVSFGESDCSVLKKLS